MSEKRIVNIGEGRLVEMTEAGELPAKPTKRQRIRNPGAKAGLRKKSERSAKFVGHQASANNHLNFHARDHIPGHREWLSARRSLTQRLLVAKPKSRLGIPDGMRRAEAEEAWVIAREKAKKDWPAAGFVDSRLG